MLPQTIRRYLLRQLLKITSKRNPHKLIDSKACEMTYHEKTDIWEWIYETWQACKYATDKVSWHHLWSQLGIQKALADMHILFVAYIVFLINGWIHVLFDNWKKNNSHRLFPLIIFGPRTFYIQDWPGMGSKRFCLCDHMVFVDQSN